MSADEMFEKIDYKMVAEDEEALYYENIDDYNIVFYMKTKLFKATNPHNELTDITMNELQAIYEKCKELGWIEKGE